MAVQPKFTIISATYNVGRYLPEFIAAIEAQDFDLTRVQVVMVDDGSSDDTYTQLLDWAHRRPQLVTAITQENAGQGAARNAGLALATGEWVTFPDPDDVLDPNYLSTVDNFVATNSSVEMVATNRLIWNEKSGEITNTHPLQRFFGRDRLVDLDLAETHFHGSAPAAFVRLSRLREHGLRFDHRIRPNFEDGHFCSLYLLHCEKPMVGFLKSTSYHYRKRADQSSSLQTSMLHPGRYTDVFTYGYLAILESARSLRGEIPFWLQHFIAYELAGYLTVYRVGRTPVITAGPEADAFHRNMGKVLGQLDLDRVTFRSEVPLVSYYRDVLLHGYSDVDWVDRQVFIDTYDPGQRLARVRYYYTGTPPSEAIYNGDVETGPRHAKTRSIDYFGRTLLHERILWARYAPDLQILLDGAWAQIVFEPQPHQHVRVNPRRVRRHTGSPSRRDRRLVARATPMPTTPTGRKAAVLAAKPRTKKRFADAWVLMDRIHDAGDSAEVLFRKLRQDRPEINAWFVIEQGTADWKRLRQEFGRRVVPHGSIEWLALMANCTNLLSSHADEPIVAPPAVLEIIEPTWRFTFLQHGVIKDDLSSWLGRKNIALFVTSTSAEFASIAGDATPYPFTTKEVKLTGLPRFDRLREVGQRFAPAARDLLLITPTWREWLAEPLSADSQRRTASTELLESDFIRTWMSFLKSPSLASLAVEHGLTIGFLPHPNLQPALPFLDLPDHVVALTYDGADVQEYFARARLLVTDYSSIAFNAAYLNRPVVYFQFDADLIDAGVHVGRPGYFDYERDGFGPVAVSTEEAITAVRTALSHGADPQPEYVARIESTFAERDGKCSDRVIEAVLALGKPDLAQGQAPTPVSRPRP